MENAQFLGMMICYLGGCFLYHSLSMETSKVAHKGTIFFWIRLNFERIE